MRNIATIPYLARPSRIASINGVSSWSDGFFESKDNENIVNDNNNNNNNNAGIAASSTREDSTYLPIVQTDRTKHR